MLRLRVGERCALQLRIGEPCSYKLGTNLLARFAFGTFEFRLPQVGPIKRRAGKPGCGEVDLPQLGIDQYSAFEPAAAQRERFRYGSDFGVAVELRAIDRIEAGQDLSIGP